jgi:NAD(P)-dependent dehydrogenase (short-subunit alcohol dehydrogenase family)
VIAMQISGIATLATGGASGLGLGIARELAARMSDNDLADGNEYLNGEVIRLDGTIRMAPR